MGIQKTRAQLEREIQQALHTDEVHGGRLLAGSSVVLPHRRTSPTCKKCGKFHTQAEHRRHRHREPRNTTTKVVKKAKPTIDRRHRAPAPRRTKATEATKTTKTVDPVTLVREATRSIHGPSRFGDRKVFISELWRKVGRELGMSLPKFKRWLVAQHRARGVVLARADLVAAMDPTLVEASETEETPGVSYPTWHFVVDDSTT